MLEENDGGDVVLGGEGDAVIELIEEEDRRNKFSRRELSFESLKKKTASSEGSRIEITVSNPEHTDCSEVEEKKDSGDKGEQGHTIAVVVSPERRPEEKDELSISRPFEVRCGVSSIQGRRKSMEDAHQAFPNLKVNNNNFRPKEKCGGEGGDAVVDELTDSLEKEVGKAVTQQTVCSFFGVYDGHGGRRAADYVAKNLHEKILQSTHFHTDIARAIKEGFMATEEEFLAIAKQNNYGDGTTAIVAFISENGKKLTVGNIGDSEAVLCRGGKAMVLTTVHNPSKNPSEIERVKREGGRLYHETRVAHPSLNPSYFNLGVSRAIGDLMFKHPDFTKGKASGLTAEADVCELQLLAEDNFLILACDGLWDVMAHQEAVDYVLRNLVSANFDPQELAMLMVEEAYKRGSTDNITVMVCILRDLGRAHREDSLNLTIPGWDTEESEDTEHEEAGEEKEDESEVRRVVEQEREGCIENIEDEVEREGGDVEEEAQQDAPSAPGGEDTLLGGDM